MKRIISSLTLLILFLMPAMAQTWIGVTERGTSIPLAKISMLTAIDGSDRFTVCLNDGSKVSDVATLSIRKDSSSAITDVIADQSEGSGNVTFQYPAASRVITVSNPYSALQAVNLYSADGRQLRSIDPCGQTQVTVDLTDLAPGVYILSCDSSTFKFIKR